jgi:hypothetical protein
MSEKRIDLKTAFRLIGERVAPQPLDTAYAKRIKALSSRLHKRPMV